MDEKLTYANFVELSSTDFPQQNGEMCPLGAPEKNKAYRTLWSFPPTIRNSLSVSLSYLLSSLRIESVQKSYSETL